MLNPVLTLDLRLNARRRHGPLARCFCAGWLALQVGALAWLQLSGPQAWDGEFGRIAAWFTWLMAAQYFLFLVLAVPAHLAGSITDEKANGTLVLLLTTEVTSRQIIMGKLVSRLLQAGLFAIIAVPLLGVIGSYYGTTTPKTMWSLLALSLGIGYALGAGSILASTCSDQARIAATRIYLLLGLGFVAWWGALAYVLPAASLWLAAWPGALAWIETIENVLLCMNPLHVLNATWGGNLSAEHGVRLKTALATHGVFGTLFTILAIWRVRPETLRALERPRRRAEGIARAHVDDEPIRWRERVTGRPWLRRGVALAGCIVACAVAWWLTTLGISWAFAPVWAATCLLACLFVGIRASGAISGERERQTWETLLVTPLETWEVVVDKRTGVLQSFQPLLAACALPIVAAACWLGWQAAVLSLGLTVLGGAMIYFMASTGIWRSAEARGSWRSLVATLARGFGYVFGWIIVVAMAAGIAIGCLTLPFIGMIVDAMGLGNFLGKYWSALVTLVCLVLAWRLHGAANLRLWYAQTWIDEHERYGRTFTRSLSRALRKHQEKVEASRREAQEARDAVATASSPPA